MNTVTRYRQHLEATAGEKTKEAFSKSPYFVKGRGEWWEWDERQLRLDQAALARAFVDLLQSGDAVVMPSALTAENGAKALLSGEFAEGITVANEDYCGCGECDFCLEYCDGTEEETVKLMIPVSWTTIKAIYKMAVEHLGRRATCE